MTHQHQLDRFLDAQEGIFDNVVSELRSGHKTGHWMWYIFPQHVGLGQSRISKIYGIESLEAAEAYLAHEVLGKRLISCTSLVLDHTGRRIDSIFAFPDNHKFRSCMTLFKLAAPQMNEFQEALDIFCGGNPDHKTLELLDDEWP